jgi:ABC-type transporter Mla MlaB component
MQDKLKEVQEALCDFIIRITKEGVSSNTVQVLPETVKALAELNKITRLMK